MDKSLPEKTSGANPPAGGHTPEKISNGIVIDHVPAFGGIRLLEALALIPKKGEAGKNEKSAPRIILLANVPSKKLGKKDILKIEGHSLRQNDADKIALICPNATLNIISNSKVSKKQALSIPKEISGMAICPNPACVCSIQKLKGKFLNQGNGFRCHYCERVFNADELIL